MNDRLLGGQVDIMCDQTTNTTGQIEAGKVKTYAVTTKSNASPRRPSQLPTLDSRGLKAKRQHLARPLCAQRRRPW